MKIIFVLIALSGIFVVLVVLGSVFFALIRNTRTGSKNRRSSPTDASGTCLPMAGLYGSATGDPTPGDSSPVTHHSSLPDPGHGHGHSHPDSGGGHSHGGFDGGSSHSSSGDSGGGGSSGGGDGGGGGGGGDGGGGS